MCQHSLLKCGYIKKDISYMSKRCYHSSKLWQTTCSIFAPVLNVPCFQSLSHYPFIFPRLYSPPSVCTDKMVFHTHLTDTDLIRGNQSPAGEKMNGMEIMQKNLSAIKPNFHPRTKQHPNLPCIVLGYQTSLSEMFQGQLYISFTVLYTPYLDCLEHLEASIYPNVDD